ncbi:uncharacterized protein SCDLUD_000485 [Saccharomycodes ludwigii]|uniref:uncharacterized protein n=1 Tax=Saccharomycodes ludwigii TaxID=36035 RepID=UPI001E8706EE|nr:hypothetical protein SCDLUD_000485 [Saccharomycodes ludwigii]KAH3902890.1 hypothetical protein SCDLUD_000485 [Saccharomycodes ludwigii]
MLTTVIGLIYYFTIFPIILANSVLTLGIFGFVLSHIQLVLETNSISLLIARYLMFPTASSQLFDKVLEKNGQSSFLIECKKKFLQQDINKIKQSSSTTKRSKFVQMEIYWINYLPFKILFLFYHIIRSILPIVISLIPVIGPITVTVLCSPAIGKHLLKRYFQLLNMNKRQIEKVSHRHWGQFVSFGLVAGSLQMLPYVSLLFEFTNLTSAALWANDVINKKIKNFHD